MGYYTTYSLSHNSNMEDIDDKIFKELSDINEAYFGEYDEFQPLMDGYFDAKWYSYNEDMIELSKRLPNVLFVLAGYGEEREDTWVTYFLNGKFQHERAEIKIGEFDPNKLQ